MGRITVVQAKSIRPPCLLGSAHLISFSFSTFLIIVVHIFAYTTGRWY
uniref:Uncharacterized protein n=1 Tax=Anguilla anguilla TaxID=7936 RepID=A0A0E9VV00_ANGAN